MIMSDLYVNVDRYLYTSRCSLPVNSSVYSLYCSLHLYLILCVLYFSGRSHDSRRRRDYIWRTHGGCGAGLPAPPGPHGRQHTGWGDPRHPPERVGQQVRPGWKHDDRHQLRGGHCPVKVWNAKIHVMF